MPVRLYPYSWVRRGECSEPQHHGPRDAERLRRHIRRRVVSLRC